MKPARLDRACAEIDAMDPSTLVLNARSLLSPTLCAYIAGVPDTRTTFVWAEGTRTPSPATQERLRAAAKAARMLELAHGPAVVRDWFETVHDSLGPRPPATLLRDSDTPVLAIVVQAARIAAS